MNCAPISEGTGADSVVVVGLDPAVSGQGDPHLTGIPSLSVVVLNEVSVAEKGPGDPSLDGLSSAQSKARVSVDARAFW